MSDKQNWRSRDPRSGDEAQRYEHPIPSREFILQTLKKQRTPLTVEELAETLEMGDERDVRALRNRLQAMVRDGQLIRNRRREYLLIAEIPVLAGTVSAHRDGFGFVALDQGGDDVFLGPREMKQVFHRDRVAVRVSGHDRRGRPEGRIVDVLDRGTTELAGRFVREAGVAFVVPENPRITHQILIPSGEEMGATPGRVVAVQLVEPPTKSSPPIGRVTEVLGDITAPGMETKVAIRSHGLPHRFPAAVTAEAAAFGDRIPSAAVDERIDLRELPLITIDGADAKDFDDAVYCEKDGRNFRLLVAIADVSHYVQPGAPLDDEAQERGTSVYFPNRVIPMLPEALSNGLCSLNPHVDRLCMVADMRVSPAGNLLEAEFYQGVMRSSARLTYKQFYSMMWEDDGALRAEHKALLPALGNLVSVYGALAKGRSKRGAVDLDIPSSRFEFDQRGHPTGVVRYSRNDAHRLIEECMITANVAAAQFLLEYRIAGLFRNHPDPDPDRVDILVKFLGTLGISMRPGTKVKPAHYQKAAAQLAERPDAGVLYFQLLRSMSQAEYAPGCEGHFGLALSEYAHFTSPIRRYPDLLVHRAINHILEDRSPKRYLYKGPDMERLGKHCSMTERRAEEAVRDVESWLKCEVMLDHVGDVFDGVIVGVVEFGVFVEISSMNIEGLVHVTSLGHDYFKLDPLGHRLVGRSSGQSFRLSQEIQVRVAGVSIEDRKIDFALAEDTSVRPRKSQPRKDKRGAKKSPDGSKKSGRKSRRRRKA